MKTSSGFTVVELLVTIVFLGIVGLLVFTQQQSLVKIHHDRDRKVAVNAIYHNLEEVVKPTLGGYPRVLKSSQLAAMNGNLLKDPQGVLIGTTGSDYRYEPTGCNGGEICTGYTLSADLDRERDFVKTNS